MKSNEEIMQVLEQLKDENNLSISEIARRVDMSKSAVSKYFNRTRSFPLSRVYDFASALNVKAEYILGYEEKKQENKVSYLPVLKQLANTSTLIAETNKDTYQPALLTDLPHGEYFFYKQTDTSMAPIIPEDAKVLIKFQEAVKNEEIAALIIDDDANILLRKIRKQEKFIFLQAENPDFDPVIITKDRKLKIIGKAIRVNYLL